MMLLPALPPQRLFLFTRLDARDGSVGDLTGIRCTEAQAIGQFNEGYRPLPPLKGPCLDPCLRSSFRSWFRHPAVLDPLR